MRYRLQHNDFNEYFGYLDINCTIQVDQNADFFYVSLRYCCKASPVLSDSGAKMLNLLKIQPTRPGDFGRTIPWNLRSASDGFRLLRSVVAVVALSRPPDQNAIDCEWSTGVPVGGTRFWTARAPTVRLNRGSSRFVGAFALI